MKVDVHLHHIPASYLEMLRADPAATGAVFSKGAAGEVLTIGGRWPFPLTPAFSDADRLCSDMEAAGVDGAILSPAPQLFRYWDEPERAIPLARRLNDDLLAVARSRPGRFWVLAHVPLQAPEEAAAELRRSVAAGACGAIIGTDMEGVPLSDPRFEPFWAEAGNLGCTVFLHPLLPEGPRMKPFFLSNLVGNPYETALAAAELIFSGVLERHPRLKLLLAHGGGHLPYQFGRMVKGYQVRAEARSAIDRPPQEYLGQLWFDTVLFDPGALRFLVEFAGPSRVVLGSDYPFGLTTWPHAQTLAALEPATAATVAGESFRALVGGRPPLG